MARDMLSSLARSPMGRSLLEFATNNGLLPTWDDPVAAGATARVYGWKLNNSNPPNAVIRGVPNDELLIILKSPQGECTLNLCDILALACAYTANQYESVKKSAFAIPTPVVSLGSIMPSASPAVIG